MPNGFLFFCEILFYLGAVLLTYKLFGKNGLFIFTAFATIFGNISVCECMNIFGFSTTGGNVIYAANFLVTDILSEKYGKKEAQKAVAYSITVMLLWLLGSQLLLCFTPNESDYVSSSLTTLFGLAPRITIASLAGFVCSQNIDVLLYHFIWDKTGNSRRMLWLRNNGATLISQALDTVIFTGIAFWGTYPTDVFVSILLTTYLFKAIVALADTPFVYAARMVTPLCEKKASEQGI